MQYGLIGEHLTHSYSCEIHSSIAGYSYELCEIAPNRLDAFMTKRDFIAINVTIPYKQAVIRYLDEISDTAKAIGAVNTVVNRDGRLFGYNTDFYGLRDLILSNGIELSGKKVLILGTGGTSKTARAVAASLGAKAIINVSRKKTDSTVTYDEAVSLHSDAQIIINTTPVGMYPNTYSTPIDLSHFKSLCGVVDAIYHPLRSNLVLTAEDLSVKACGGLYMLSAQAVYASEKFLDTQYDKSVIQKAYKNVLDQKRNIVLIGMPSAGKTTIGKRLSKLTGKKFVDTDSEIITKIGMPISDYFAKYGEAQFRRVECDVIKELSDKSGLVIATGGGSVLNADNRRHLKQNGIVLLLDRSLKNLMFTPDRPLSSDKDALKRLYEQRIEIYKATADVTINADKTINDTLNTIKRTLSL